MGEITGILLAAGSANRFGSDKLLHPLEDGTAIGIGAAKHLIEAVPNSIAVIRSGDTRLASAFAAIGMRCVENPRADTGMGTSLSAGISATADASGWIIALADMPWIQPGTIRKLAEHLGKDASIVAPVCQGRRGHPVGFAAHWFDELAALTGDTGARSLLQEHPDAITLLEVEDTGVLQDIDLPGDVRG